MKTASSRVRLGVIAAGVALLLAWWWVASRAPSVDASKSLPSIVEPATSATASYPNSRSTLAAKLPVSAIPGMIPAGTPATFNDAVAKLNQSDAEYVKSANTKLLGALDYHSLAELHWKLERGFPTLEEVLALRGKPAPRPLSNDEAKLLNARELTKHFLQLALTAQIKPGTPYDPQPHATWGVQMQNITRERDTPFPAHLRASMLDITDKFAQWALVRDALSAALNGDGGLLSEELMKRLMALQNLRRSWDVEKRDAIGPKYQYDIDSTYNFIAALEQIYASERTLIYDQTQGCFDRHVGNPRIAESVRRDVQRDEANCK